MALVMSGVPLQCLLNLKVVTISKEMKMKSRSIFALCGSNKENIQECH